MHVLFQTIIPDSHIDNIRPISFSWFLVHIIPQPTAMNNESETIYDLTFLKFIVYYFEILHINTVTTDYKSTLTFHLAIR
jgi:hypothetical protein